jgi:hypothetical protein
MLWPWDAAGNSNDDTRTKHADLRACFSIASSKVRGIARLGTWRKKCTNCATFVNPGSPAREMDAGSRIVAVRAAGIN